MATATFENWHVRRGASAAHGCVKRCERAFLEASEAPWEHLDQYGKRCRSKRQAAGIQGLAYMAGTQSKKKESKRFVWPASNGSGGVIKLYAESLNIEIVRQSSESKNFQCRLHAGILATEPGWCFGMNRFRPRQHRGKLKRGWIRWTGYSANQHRESCAPPFPVHLAIYRCLELQYQHMQPPR